MKNKTTTNYKLYSHEIPGKLLIYTHYRIIAFSMPIAALQGHNRSRLRATPWPMRNEPLVVDPYMRLRIVFWSNGKLQNELVMWILRFRWPLIYPLVNPPVLKPSVNLKRNDQLFANQITRGYRRRLKMISLASRAILLVSSKNKDVAPKKPGVAASSSTLSPLPFLGFLACKNMQKENKTGPWLPEETFLAGTFLFLCFIGLA